ncbi:glutathione degradosome [Lepidopterella palustris CBS 459.81]|uniref:Glutathione degradosome n=1 Tax=Lepidopterella palustris CBS 459.81 TaxID=1314670 RepID=A0A8E2E9Y2_9PEZI|nr:glutathione degradosome [Lepidopterella palustris CBS 459.81]
MYHDPKPVESPSGLEVFRNGAIGRKWTRDTTVPHEAMEVEVHGRRAASTKPAVTPVLLHRLRHDKSILALVVSSTNIFAGTQGGEILVYSLDTYERVAVIEGHRGSVLGLCLSQDQDLLFSSAGDRIVNVWNTQNFSRLYSIYSTYDVGDIFCVSYSSTLQTVYLGAQNTSIQWYDLREKDTRPQPSPTSHPSFREDRFFDSPGPGGVRTPRPQPPEGGPRHATGGRILELDKQYIRQFAHYGYVYCMLLARGILSDDPTEEILISGGGDGVIRLWQLDAANGGAIHEIHKLEDGREEGEAVLTLAVEGTFLYSGRLDGEINVWDLETKQLVRNLKAETDDVLTLSVGGGFLFTAGVSGIVQKFNRQYETVTEFQAHDRLILASAFAIINDRPTFVTGGNDNTIAVWNVRDCISAPSSKRTSNEHLIESLKQFISFRTVSSDPRYKGDCRRGASYLRSVFKNFGAATEMLNTEDPYNPVILAKFRGNPAKSASRKKILFYGHYDVIPAENEQGKWIGDPFSLLGIDGYLYGRGVSDNKGPIMAAIYAVNDLKEEQALDSDVIFLIEGEEECGSRGFEDAVRNNKELIGNVDWILLANSYWLDDHVPCLTYGLRGVIHATIKVESQHPDLHSGVDGSAMLDESLKDLIMVLAKLMGPEGKIEIPGFYDPILPISNEEKRLYSEITETLLRGNPELGDPRQLAISLMRRWREASLTIHRFHTSGPENSTIIPRMAEASLSLRLVPNQTSAEVARILTDFLHSEFAKLASQNRLEVTIDHQAEPWLGDFHNEIFKTLEEAIMEVWGPTPGRRKSSVSTLKSISERHGYSDSKPSPATSSTLANGPAEGDGVGYDETSEPTTLARKPLYIREGGSIPSIRFLEKEFEAPAAHLPCGQASDSAHLDNERLRQLNLTNSREIFKKVFRDLPKK